MFKYNIIKLMNFLKRVLEYGALKLIIMSLKDFMSFFFFIGIFLTSKNHAKDKPLILLVTHDSTLTGAPVLALEISNKLKKNYSIFLLSLGDGQLESQFRKSNQYFLKLKLLKFSALYAYFYIYILNKFFKFKYAITNTVESGALNSSLAKNFIPTVNLIHEYCSYTQPKDKYISSFFWSTCSIFSSDVLWHDFSAHFPYVKNSPHYIFPQGKVYLENFFNPSDLTLEKNKIDALIQKKAKNKFVVISAGFIQHRKGCDLFISFADKLLKLNPKNKNKIHFFWIGAGLNKEPDGLSEYINKQLDTFEIRPYVTFVDSTINFKHFLRKADLFALTSRLDPLPNVAIDALANKIPLLCFDHASGIVNFLKFYNLDKNLVAKYLDYNDMANKANLLLHSSKQRGKLAELCYKAYLETFNMDKYINNIIMVLKEAEKINNQQLIDFEFLSKKLSINNKFAYPNIPYKSFYLQLFIRSWTKGFSRRKPFPGFNPKLFSKTDNLEKCFTDSQVKSSTKEAAHKFVNYQVINSMPAKDFKMPKDKKIALHIHAYYPELLSDILDRLFYNRFKLDLFVSTCDSHSEKLIRSLLKKYPGKVKAVKVFPNAGRDLGPFFVGFGPAILSNYDYVGHLHTKKADQVKDKNVGDVWFKFILDNLLGNQSAGMMDSILIEMMKNESLGMVFPDDPNVISWDANFDIATKIGKQLSITNLPQDFIFPVGSMFFARTDAIKPFLKLKLKWNDLPEEPLPYDGTMLHAIERLFPFVVEKAGFSIAVSHLKGTSR